MMRDISRENEDLGAEMISRTMSHEHSGLLGNHSDGLPGSPALTFHLSQINEIARKAFSFDLKRDTDAAVS